VSLTLQISRCQGHAAPRFEAKSPARSGDDDCHRSITPVASLLAAQRLAVFICRKDEREPSEGPGHDVPPGN
jgi:hypothetical protein